MKVAFNNINQPTINIDTAEDIRITECITYFAAFFYHIERQILYMLPTDMRVTTIMFVLLLVTTVSSMTQGKYIPNEHTEEKIEDYQSGNQNP